MGRIIGKYIFKEHVDDFLYESGKVYINGSQTQALRLLVQGYTLGSESLDNPWYSPEDFTYMQEKLPGEEEVGVRDGKVDREAEMFFQL